MIITSQYILILALSAILTVFAWGIEATWVIRKTGLHHFKKIRNITAILLVLLLIWLTIINFTATLTLFVLACGLVVLIDQLFFRHKRLQANHPEPLIVEQARSFFFILLIVWAIRSFIVQPYRVPTGSLQPTVLPGDFLVVNQYTYGLRFPVINNTIIDVGKPKRGNLVLFYSPADLSMILVKRVIGLPGDLIEYRNKVLYINDEEMAQTYIGETIASEPAFHNNPERHFEVIEKEENLNGIKHSIYISANQPNWLGDFSLHVPEGQYFMMGDNRDNSGDSRIWGAVAENLLIGKPFIVLLSWDSIRKRMRFDRFGKPLT